jgi:putative heme degradation protein
MIIVKRYKHAPMAIFKTLINIDIDLRNIFGEIEEHFFIKLNEEIIEKIFRDAEEDQVAGKEYLIFQGEKKLLGSHLIILGTVGTYEPEDIWIEIQNIKERDLKHFNDLISG